MGREKHQAALLGDRLIVWDPAEGSELYKAGYFGKPVGIAKPKTAEFDVPLLLDPMEGYYLAETKRLNVVDQFTGKRITQAGLKRCARKAIDQFDAKYKVYSDLRRKGYVVTTGIKFGCDFAVYEHGPGIDHAPYMVQVKKG
ncbi:MAG: tRNA-intron lyase, partial [Candidatus Bathyarchaeia archaeon]